MADNFHPYDDEQEEQDQIITDLTALQTQVNNIDLTTINNKLAGTASSGLKTLIEGNDTDIQNIQTKTDFISISQNVDLDEIETHTNLNNAKNSYPSGDAVKVGRITIDGNLNLTNMNSSITTNTNAIDAIELKTDHISISQAVDLDVVEALGITNQTNIASNLSSLTTSIASNTTAIQDNDTDLTAVGQMLAGTSSSGLKTLIGTNETQIAALLVDTTNKFAMSSSTGMKTAIDLNTAKTSFPGFGTSGSTALAGNTALLQLGTSGTTALAGDTTTITSDQATDIANAKTELGNVELTTTNISNTRILLGSGTGFANGVALQNAQLNSGTLANTHLALKQDNNGGTFLNCVTGRSISFRRNNVELFNDGEIQPLTDNITVSSAVNLNNNTTNIATNTSDISTLTTATNNRFSLASATTLSNLAQANEADIVTATNSIAANGSNITTNQNNINILLKPIRIHCYAHMISHVGSTAKNAGTNLIDITNSDQRIRWDNVISSSYLNGIVWTTLSSVSQTYFHVPETALYHVQAKIILMFSSSSNERQATLSLSHYNNSNGTITNIRQTHSSMNRQDGNNYSFTDLGMDTPVLLENGADDYYFFRCKSLDQGNIRIHSSSGSANSVVIKYLTTDNAGNSFGSASGFDMDGSLSFVGI